MPKLLKPYYFALAIMSMLLFIMLNLCYGTLSINANTLFKIFTFQENSVYADVVFNMRLPNTLMAILVGLGLSVSGLLMQTYFQNPIASPYLLGVSFGASFGVAIGIFLFQQINQFALVSFGITGSMAILVLLLLIAFRVQQNSTLLVIGILLGNIISAIVELIQFFAPAHNLQRFILWGQSGIQGSSLWEVLSVTPVILLSLIYIFMRSKNLDALLLGKAYANSLGINIKVLEWEIIIITGIITGSLTAFCGPIGFIGIIAPHLARWIFQTQKHNTLIIATGLLGINLVLIAAFLTQIFSSNTPLPINALMALLGIPIVFSILWKQNTIS